MKLKIKIKNENSKWKLFFGIDTKQSISFLIRNGLEDYKPKFIKKANVAFPYGNWSHHFT